MNASTPVPLLKLLVAVDHSAHSDAALRWLASLKTTGLNAQCVLLYVQAPVMSGEVGLIAPADVAAEAHERTAAAALAHAAQVLHDAGFACIVARETDTDIVAAILACAQAQGCDAIVLGRRGRGALRAALLGSVSAGVVQRAAVPVILINHRVQPAAAQPLRILLASDGSQAADRATAIAARIAAHSAGGQVHVLHVRPDISFTETIFGPTERLIEQLSGPNETQALERARDLVERAGAACALFPVVAGVPHEVIMREADAVSAGMIAMGTRGLAPASGLVLGSVAQHVVQHARVPVMLSR